MWKQWFIVVTLVIMAPAQAQDVATIAAASDLKFALDEVLVELPGRDRSAQGPCRLRLVRQLLRQIRRARRSSCFSRPTRRTSSSSPTRPDRDHGALYAVGRIVLFAPKGSPLQADARSPTCPRPRRRPRDQVRHRQPRARALRTRGRAGAAATGLWEPTGRSWCWARTSRRRRSSPPGSAQGGIFALSLALSPRRERAAASS